MALPKLYFTSNTQRTVGEVVRWVTEDDGYYPIELNPPYQRGAVWSLDQKVNLIKSVLIGLPIGGLFINHRDPHNYTLSPRVVDGQQRLRALSEFMNDGFAIPTEWVDDRAEEQARAEQRKARNAASSHDPEDTNAYPSIPQDFDAPTVLYSQLTPRAQRSFKGTTIGVYETDLPTEAQEAEMHLLINFGGVAQSDEDRARAQAVADSDWNLD